MLDMTWKLKNYHTKLSSMLRTIASLLHFKLIDEQTNQFLAFCPWGLVAVVVSKLKQNDSGAGSHWLQLVALGPVLVSA